MIVASIDLQAGQLVCVEDGRIAVRSDLDVLARAAFYARFGRLQVVDLDGIAGSPHPATDDVIQRLCRAHDCYVAGGVRTVDDAERRLAWGARKVVVGSFVFDPEDPGRIHASRMRELVRRIGIDHVAGALDVMDDVRIDGWATRTGLDPIDVARALTGSISELILASIPRELSMAGVDRELVDRFASAIDMPFAVASGISSIEDVRYLTRIGADAIIGTALHTDRLDPHRAYAAGLG